MHAGGLSRFLTKVRGERCLVRAWPVRFFPSLGVLTVVLGCIGCAASMDAAGASAGAAPRGARGKKGAPWTILCLELRGPERRVQMEQIAETLRQTPGIRAKDVYLRDGRDGAVRLYYGTHFRRTDAKTGKRDTPKQLRDDLLLIRQLGSGPGQYFFLRALTVRAPTPDVGPPEWNLLRATGKYTLQVGIFEPTDEFWEFKQAAAEYCQLLRDKGYEAYYYHTDAASMVTVGAFGEDALVPHESGVPRYSAQVLALQQSDELLKYNLLNGSIYKGQVYASPTEKGERVPVPSRLVMIPHDGAAGP